MESPPASHEPPRRVVWPAVACALAGVAVFQFYGNATRGYVNTDSLFWWWASQWLDPLAETEHGFIVLAVSGWLFWRNLRKVESRELSVERPEPGSPFGGWALNSQPSTLNPSMAALAAMLAGLAVHAAGFVVQQSRVSIAGLLIFAWGVLRLAGGRRWGMAAGFPLAFLVFAIPVNVFDSVGFWLRMAVVQSSASIAHGVGIDVLQNGTQLTAPDGRYQYDVVAACSGVRSLTALAALAALAGYLSFRTWGRRALVLGLCAPLVYLGNVARLTAIIFAAQLGGSEWGERVHAVMGFGVFAIVLGGLLVAVRLIERWWPEWTDDGRLTADNGRQRSVDRTDRSESALRPLPSAVWVALLVPALAVVEMIFLHRVAHLAPRGGAGVVLAADQTNPVDLPTFIGTQWIGQEAVVSAVEREILPKDTGFSRKVYFSHRDPSKAVLLSIVLSGRDRTSIHRPELCLVGQGWTILDTVAQRFRVSPPVRTAENAAVDAAAEFPATLLRVRREVSTPQGTKNVPQLVAYWFVNADKVVATHWSRFIHDAWNRLTRARADRWAYVLMQTDAADGEAAALARMQAVLDGTLPAFQKPMVAR